MNFRCRMCNGNTYFEFNIEKYLNGHDDYISRTACQHCGALVYDDNALLEIISGGCGKISNQYRDIYSIALLLMKYIRTYEKNKIFARQLLDKGKETAKPARRGKEDGEKTHDGHKVS